MGLITSFIYFQTVNEPNYAAGYGITLLITVISHIAFTTIIVAQKTDEVKIKIDETSNGFKKFQIKTLEEHLRIRKITDEEAEKYIGKSILDADTVKNTYVNISKYYGAETSIGKGAISQYEAFLGKSEGSHWIDITTYGDIHEGRFDSVNLQGRNHGQHTIHIVNSETDIINFLLVEKNNSPIEVYFGWIADATDSIRIFQTREASIIDLFENYFNLLRSRSIEVFDADYRREKALLPSRTNTLIGRWLTVSLVKNVKSADEYNRYSILEIKIDEGAWSVDVEIYEREPHMKVSVISTKHAQAYGRSIFYEFVRRDVLNDIQEEGLATYSVTEISNDIISGVYVIPGKGKLVRTHAVRLSEEDSKARRTDSAAMKKYIEQLWQTPELGLRPKEKK